jgi:cation:H+ antiporter
MPLEMNMFYAAVLLPAGLFILLKGATWLVDGAVGLAKKLGVSPLVIGLTIVAMGTSAPEVAASITAAAKGLADTAIGNVYGSNIANLALVGGLCAIIRPINVKSSVLRREMPAMLIVTLLLWPVLADLVLTRPESAILLGCFAAMILYTIISALRQARNRPQEVPPPDDNIKIKQKTWPVNLIFILLGLGALALGANLTVRAAVFIGQKAGLSQAVIGLTIIAVGTSLPELMTCVVAALKGHDDLSIGNLVGSNVFNTLLVTGTAGAISSVPFNISSRLIGFDYWTMVAVSAIFVAIAIFRKKITRLAGMALLAGYVGYMVYLLAFTRGV